MIFVLKILAILFFSACAGFASILYFRKAHEIFVKFVKEKTSFIFEKWIRMKRTRKIESQLVDAVEMLANGLMAGLSLQQSMSMVSGDAPCPIKEEFGFVLNQIKVGKSVEDALGELKARVAVDDIAILVDSILILRRTGGNLIETFASIASTIRERQNVKSKIKVVTAEGLTQAAIIMLLPFALGGGLFFVARWYIETLFTSAIGWCFVALALLLQAMGALWIKKIISIRV